MLRQPTALATWIHPHTSEFSPRRLDRCRQDPLKTRYLSFSLKGEYHGGASCVLLHGVGSKLSARASRSALIHFLGQLFLLPSSETWPFTGTKSFSLSIFSLHQESPLSHYLGPTIMHRRSIWTRETTTRRLIFNFLFHGAHIAAFAAGW